MGGPRISGVCRGRCRSGPARSRQRARSAAKRTTQAEGGGTYPSPRPRLTPDKADRDSGRRRTGTGRGWKRWLWGLTCRMSRRCEDRALAGPQPRGDQAEQVLIGIGAGEQQPDASGIAEDHCADFEQLQPDRADIGAGQFGLHLLVADLSRFWNTTDLSLAPVHRSPVQHRSIGGTAMFAGHPVCSTAGVRWNRGRRIVRLRDDEAERVSVARVVDCSRTWEAT